MTAKCALIFGMTGQDGAYLAEFLLGRGYQVHGTSRTAAGTAGNLQRLKLQDRVRLHTVSPVVSAEVHDIVKAVQPTEIYYVAGQASVVVSFEDPVATFSSHVTGLLNVLEAMRAAKPDARLYSASSGQVFGDRPTPSAEDCPFNPCSPYGAAKVASMQMIKIYREVHGIFACAGITFNHESPLRPASYVPVRIVQGAFDIAQKRRTSVQLGNLHVVRDWGWAPEFVECFWLMLQQPVPEDFVIATGIGSSLQDFVDRAFKRFGLNWRDHVTTDASLLRPADIAVSIGNPAKARAKLGWQARVTMPEIADRLAEAITGGAAGPRPGGH